jgi:hypothetical protein
MGYNLGGLINYGQSGGAYLDDTGVFVAPTGKVIVAINVVIADTSFTTLTPSNDTGSNTYHIGTAVTAATHTGNGTNAEAIASGDNFPAGQWIYGRWSACTLADGAVFLYFAEA